MIVYSKRLKNRGRAECTRYIRRYRHIREEKKKKRKKEVARHEQFGETVFNEQRIFQLTRGKRVHAKLARARCKRRAERHKEKKTFCAWNNHDCLWPSSTWPASLARSWSRTIPITRWTQTSKPSGSSSARFFHEKMMVQFTQTREISISHWS